MPKKEKGSVIKTTLGECSAAEQGLQGLLTVRCNAITAYRLARLHRVVAVEAKHFTDQRAAIIKELGEESDGPEGKMIKVKPEHVETFNKRMEELAAVKVDVEATPFSIAALGDAEVSPAWLAALGPFLADDGPAGDGKPGE